MDFDLKIDLIVFDPEIGSAPSNFFSGGRRVLQTKDSSAESYSFTEELVTATEGLVVFLYDSAGNILPNWRIFSELINSQNSLLLRGDLFTDILIYFVRTCLHSTCCHRDIWTSEKNVFELRVQRYSPLRKVVVLLAMRALNGTFKLVMMMIEDTRDSQNNLNVLEEEFQERALLAQLKGSSKMVVQVHVVAKATDEA
ncbi:hypothetical protein Tco_0834035 [Tanacetum coccineum]